MQELEDQTNKNMSGMEFSETLKLVSEMKMAWYYWNLHH